MKKHVQKVIISHNHAGALVTKIDKSSIVRRDKIGINNVNMHVRLPHAYSPVSDEAYRKSPLSVRPQYIPLQENSHGYPVDTFGFDLKKIDEFASSIGPEIARYGIGNGITLSLYKAKNLHSAEWFSESLKNLVMEARKSYLRYGEVPQDDVYDAKSVVYIGRAAYEYEVKGIIYPAEEWLSVRFVPADGTPQYTEDLEFCLVNDRVLVDWFLNSDLNKKGDILKRIFTISRICSIAPHISHSMSTHFFNRILSKKLMFTGVLLSLMSKQFLKDCAVKSIPCELITGLFRDEFIEKSLTVLTPRETRIPDFSYGYKTLGLSDISALKLNRSLFSHYFYKFPSYFLNMDQLFSALNDLINQKQMSMQTLDYYIKGDMRAAEWMQTSAIFKRIGKDLGNVISTAGALYDSHLTGEYLRRLLNARVSDGPHLRVMRTNAWIKSIEKYLKACDIRRLRRAI